jgi:hypothetical protein
VKSQETASQVTIGAVARIPKMNPNFRKSMMISNEAVLRSSVPEAYMRADGRRVATPPESDTAVA